MGLYPDAAAKVQRQALASVLQAFEFEFRTLGAHLLPNASNSCTLSTTVVGVFVESVRRLCAELSSYGEQVDNLVQRDGADREVVALIVRLQQVRRPIACKISV